MDNKNKKKWLMPVIVLVVATVIAFSLGAFKQQAVKQLVEESTASVDVVTLTPVSRSVSVKTQGVVSARTHVRLLPEVSGLIVNTSKKWQNGGFFKRGETLLQIETHQYKNQVARAEASVAQAHSAYIQEQGQSFVAEKEWERRQSKENNGAAKALALRKPQLESAKAQYEAARADLTAAKINLTKTTITAPFDGIVLKKTADIGQFISVGQLLAEFLAIDYVEVRIPLTESNQNLINLPSLTGANKTEVNITYSGSHGERDYKGYLVRTESVLDEMTKVLYGVVEIKDPYGLESKDENNEPLRIGTYVQVNIPGRKIDGLYVLPARSLRRGNKVWLLDKDNVLSSQDVSLLSNHQGESIVYAGFSGETVKVVVGSVGKAMQGRKVESRELSGVSSTIEDRDVSNSDDNLELEK